MIREKIGKIKYYLSFINNMIDAHTLRKYLSTQYHVTEEDIETIMTELDLESELVMEDIKETLKQAPIELKILGIFKQLQSMTNKINQEILLSNNDKRILELRKQLLLLRINTLKLEETLINLESKIL